MYSKFYSPNILATGSSELGESSYSHENDNDIGVAVIDSYTHYVLEYLEQVNKTSRTTMQDFFNHYDPVPIKSHPGVRSDLFSRPVDQTLLTDFFGGVAQVELMDETASVGPIQDSSAFSSENDSMSSLPRAKISRAPSDSVQKESLGKGQIPREMRAWIGTLLVLLLGTWVARPRKRS